MTQDPLVFGLSTTRKTKRGDTVESVEPNRKKMRLDVGITVSTDTTIDKLVSAQFHGDKKVCLSNIERHLTSVLGSGRDTTFAINNPTPRQLSEYLGDNFTFIHRLTQYHEGLKSIGLALSLTKAEAFAKFNTKEMDRLIAEITKKQHKADEMTRIAYTQQVGVLKDLITKRRVIQQHFDYLRALLVGQCSHTEIVYDEAVKEAKEIKEGNLKAVESLAITLFEVMNGYAPSDDEVAKTLTISRSFSQSDEKPKPAFISVESVTNVLKYLFMNRD